jgi:hypothetical protein
MKQFTSYLKNNIQTSISVFALAALALSNTYFIVQAQDDNSKQEQRSEYTKPAASFTDEQAMLGGDPPYDPALFPHANCIQKNQLTETPSTTFNPDVPYNLSFFKAGNPSPILQDVNGDNLPDYVWAYSVYDSGYQRYEGCVYLNNGSGWTKAYECYATTRIDLNTQSITEAAYYGDCAGEPSAKQEN